ASITAWADALASDWSCWTCDSIVPIFSLWAMTSICTAVRRSRTLPTTTAVSLTLTSMRVSVVAKPAEALRMDSISSAGIRHLLNSGGNVRKAEAPHLKNQQTWSGDPLDNKLVATHRYPGADAHGSGSAGDGHSERVGGPVTNHDVHGRDGRGRAPSGHGRRGMPGDPHREGRVTQQLHGDDAAGADLDCGQAGADPVRTPGDCSEGHSRGRGHCAVVGSGVRGDSGDEQLVEIVPDLRVHHGARDEVTISPGPWCR